MLIPAAVVAPESRQRVEDFVNTVACAIDDDELERFPLFFAEDATYKIISRFNADRGLPLAPLNCTGRKMIVDRITSLRQANIYPEHRYRHLISSVRIVPSDNPDVVDVRSSYLVIRIMADGTSSIYSSGEYHDRIRVDGATPLLVSRTVVCDSKSIDSVLVIPI